MTTTDLKLLTEAAEGPWDVAIEQGCHAIVASVLPEGANIIAIIFNSLDTPEREPLRFANARLIALAPTLAQEVLDLRAEVARLREALIEAIPWVEANIEDVVNKPGVVSAVSKRLRAALRENGDE